MFPKNVLSSQKFHIMNNAVRVKQSHTGQNYLRSLFALGFQGFLIMICVGIYAVLIQNMSFSDNIISSIWGVMGYTVLLAFTLFKTGSLAKSVFAAH